MFLYLFCKVQFFKDFGLSAFDHVSQYLLGHSVEYIESFNVHLWLPEAGFFRLFT